MNFIFNMIKGAIIGIANIIPGVSGGTMALSLNIYDKLIEAIGNFFKDIKKNFLFLLPIVMGAGIGIVLFSSIIKYSLEHFNMSVNFFFIGLIIGSIPLIYKTSKENKFKKTSLISFVIAFTIMIILSILTVNDNTAITNLNIFNFLRLFISSMIAASCMILPGISGSLVLMILGCYTTILTAITDMNILVLIPVALGVGVGILLGAKVIDICIKKYKQQTYYAILGLIIGSIFSIIKNTTFAVSIEIMFALLLFIVGIIITYTTTKK